MIIKRNQAPRPEAPAPDFALEQMAPEPETLPYNEDTVAAGLVPDRRGNDRRNDRRRGYRRIEDKNLISKAYEEANAIRENAQQEGFQEGLMQAESTIAELRNAIEHIMALREDALLSVTSEIASIAVEVAARIIKTEVSCDESLVMSLVRDTIQKAGRGNKTIIIKLNPEDTALVKRTLKDDPIPNLHAELIVMDDPTVDAGSCIIETNSGLIDASFSTQLGILRQLFGGKD